MSQFLSNPQFQAFDSNGDPLNGGLVYTYEPGTTTNKATYPTLADAKAATNANANPVVLDSRGEASIVLIGNTKIVLKDSDGNTIWTLDNINSDGTILDANGKEIIEFSATSSAVNEFTISNAATGNGPDLAATGDDSNIDISLTPKGTGNVTINTNLVDVTGTTASGAEVRLHEDVDNGTNYIGFKAPSNLTSSVTWLFPNGDGASGKILQTDGAGQLSWVSRLVDVVDDTTPQLGGNLDVNSKEIQSLSGTDIVLHSDNDVNVILGDAAGADDFNVKDSAGTIVASINSDGAMNVASGQDYQINATSVLNATTLGSGVVASSLTSVGTLTSLDVDNINLNGNTISTTSGGELIVSVANTGDWAQVINNTHATNPFGLSLAFTGASPDDNTAKFLNCADGTTNRCIIYSDGDLQNHDNSYGAISDERLKKDIKEANSQWDDIRDLPIKKYKFKSDKDNREHLGLVAQEIMESNPGLVNYDKKEDLYSVQYSILYMKAVKALQEALIRIEKLESQINA
jgi:hypothetical protein